MRLIMPLKVGEKVAYPNQGVCLVEEFKQCTIGGRLMRGYSLRVQNDNSTIFVPEENAGSVGIRPLISSSQCEQLIDKLSEDFEPVSCDWKTRSREFSERMRSGDVFQAAEVFKMLTFLSHEKKLSFREQTLLEKSKFLILSEIKNAYTKKRPPVEDDIIGMVESACSKHVFTQPKVMSVAVH
jgi:CarD family transcriptional regulator, regulator of rRNA transcription